MFKSARVVVAGLVGAGLAVTPLAAANAATSTTTKYVQVSLAGKTCNSFLSVKQKLNHTKITLAEYSDPLGHSYDYFGGSTTHTYQVDARDVPPAGIAPYIFVQTWCGHGPFVTLMGKTADTCYDDRKDDPVWGGGLGTKRQPYKLTVNMDTGQQAGAEPFCG